MFNSGNSTPFTMPVTPAYGNGGGMGGWGNDWIALAILALIFGDGWGMGGMGGMGMFWPFMMMNGGFGGFGGNGCGCGNGNSNAIQADIQRGFDTQSIIGKLDGINNGLCDGFYAVNTSILNAQSGIQNSLCQGFNGLNTNIMQGNFGLQQAINNASVANMQGQNALQSQLASCCCETQRAIDGVNYNMATNTCSITNQMNNNTRDIIESNNAGTRAILDYLCQDKISTLQSENQALRLAASQANQNNVLMAAMDSNKAEILRKTGAECPTAAYIVQPPQPVTFPTNCCGGVNYAGYGNNGCGCNSGCC
ncbi:hypothetical protein C810_01328 [Lachnospiraceae bacterium A2]|nr:hypothetical protein C810_01328 [Lachnospiraceae bacterium A2]